MTQMDISASKIVQPNFLIIGTMKGGTTALYDFITLHPDIDRAKNKEIHYFSLNYHMGRDWYLNHFKAGENRITGEASPTYFDVANTTLIPNLIYSFNPEMKIILIVRDPIERAVSHYNHFIKVLAIPEVSDLNLNEFFCINIREAISETSTLGFYLNQVLSFSFYCRKYLNYLDVFNQKGCLVLSNKELRMSPTETMENVYKFLGVTPRRFDEFREIKYSLGTNIFGLEEVTFNQLADLFYPDYKKFCDISGIEYSELTPNFSSKNFYRNDKNSINTSDGRKIKNSGVVDSIESDRESQKDVHTGKNGWLFLLKGTNNSFAYYMNPGLFSEEMIRDWIDLLNSRIDCFLAKRIRYVHLFVPNKLTLYPEYFNGALPFFSSSPLPKLYRSFVERRENKILDHIINPISYYNRLKKTHQLFWKTDTHWTFFGVYGAYQLICAKLGILANKELLQRERNKDWIIMDEGGKLDPPVTEEAIFYNLLKDARRVYANQMVEYKEMNKLEGEMGLHVGSNVIFRNENSPNPEKVVLFGDSFSEYRPHLLTGTLAETFREVHFVWSTSLDNKYIENNKPDVVITEIVERFMPRVPTDKFDLEDYCRTQLDLKT
jgi:hypothetical protein